MQKSNPAEEPERSSFVRQRRRRQRGRKACVSSSCAKRKESKKVRKSTIRTLAYGLAAVVAFSTLAPAGSARAEGGSKVAEAGESNILPGLEEAEENTLYLTADMADKGQIIISGGAYDRIVIPKEIGQVKITFDESEVGELIVESGSRASVLLRATTAAKVTVEEPKLKEIDWVELKHLLADEQTSGQAIQYYMRLQEENTRYLNSSPRITTAKGAVINSLIASAGVSMDLKNAEVGSLSVKTGEKLTRAEIAVEGYYGDIAYTGNDRFGIVSLKLKNSEIGRMSVSEACGNNYLLVSGKDSFADNIEVAGNAKVSLNIPADDLTVTADAGDARVDILNKIDSMNVAADNAKIEIAPIGSVESAEVSGNEVSIGGSGTLGKADVTGESAHISTNGTTVKGENTYTPPVYTAPVVTVAPTPGTEPTTKPTPTPLPEIKPPVPATGSAFVYWVNAGLEDHAMDWEDVALEAAMREITGIADGPVMLSQVWEIAELDLNSKGIGNISALAELKNLTDLNLSYNREISDISALSELTNLMKLDLKTNKISDIRALLGLTNLTYVNLSDNKISDIRALAWLTNLEHLELWCYDISNIDALSELTNLTYLELGANRQISDISALEKLTNLTHLGLSSNTQISDISVLKKLTNLTYLDLDGTNLSDISALAGLTNLTRLYLQEYKFSDISALSGLTNLRSLYLAPDGWRIWPGKISDYLRTGISDISMLERLTKLETLVCGYSQISDISVLSKLTNLSYLNLNDTKIEDISVLSELTNLSRLSLKNNSIRDISALSKLQNLREVNLSGNNISDIRALSGLRLHKSYYSTFVKWDDAGLEDHEMLWKDDALEAAMSRITGITDRPIMLSDVWEIKFLNLRVWNKEGKITNISALSELVNLTELALSDNAILDITVLSELKNLHFLWLDNNKISDVTALSELKNLECVYLQNNPITDYSPVDHVKDVQK